MSTPDGPHGPHGLVVVDKAGGMTSHDVVSRTRRVLGTRKVLTRLPGVAKADVSYEKGTAVVTYDPRKVTVEQMVAAIRTLGYTATPVAPAAGGATTG